MSKSTPFDAETEEAGATRIETESVGLVGLGYVGLPLAVALAEEGLDVVGYDIDDEKLRALRDGRDPTGCVGDEAVDDAAVEFTGDPAAVGESDVVIVAVPTPVDEMNRPDPTYVRAAGETVGAHMSEGTTVVLESTVYPGMTGEVFVPALESASGLTRGEDFGVGYSPERATPGDDEHGLRDVVKVVAADDPAVLTELSTLYRTVVDAGVHEVSDVRVAEAAKCAENVQRDVNIALVNELAMTFDRMGIDTQAVLDAAGTKWNFHQYTPGLVGGHCIPVDPYYFAYGAERAGHSPDLVTASRQVNDEMIEHVRDLVLRALNDAGKVPRESRALVLGLTYKADVSQLGNTPIAEVVADLRDYGMTTVGYDPHADADAASEAVGVDVVDAPTYDGVDVVLVATDHSDFDDLDLDAMAAAMDADPAIVDLVGAIDPDEAAGRGFVHRRL